MSRFTDQNLRAAFRLRAAGQPRPGLRQRIRHATRPAQEPRTVAVIHGTAHRRPILVRFTAIAAVAAVLILAPLVGAGSDVWRRPDPYLGQPTPDERAAVAIASAIKDGEDDEDREDGEDDEDDEGEADDEDDDEGDDDDDDGDDEDDDDPEESEEDR
ncbi:MAG: hypothetical protein ACRDGB_01965 [Candidatus Limnocylindria bacterium]